MVTKSGILMYVTVNTFYPDIFCTLFNTFKNSDDALAVVGKNAINKTTRSLDVHGSFFLLF